jgi:hypothetical protein
VALKERGIDKLVEEAREDNKDNDATYLGRKCRSPEELLEHTTGANELSQDTNGVVYGVWETYREIRCTALASSACL